MVKTLISLTERQMEVLGTEAGALGISKSELLRRVMDKYLDSGKKLTKEDISKKPTPKTA
jgi:hypothetical protein